MPVDFLVILVVWAFIAAFVLTQRLSHCNNVTLSQRMKMLDDIHDELVNSNFEPQNAKMMMKALDSVSYGKHVRTLFLGRDPYALYKPVTFTKVDPRDID